MVWISCERVSVDYLNSAAVLLSYIQCCVWFSSFLVIIRLDNHSCFFYCSCVDSSTPVVLFCSPCDFLPACLNLVQTDVEHIIKTVCSSELCCDCFRCSLCHEMCGVQNHTVTSAAILNYKLVIHLQYTITLHNFLTSISIFFFNWCIYTSRFFPFH